jgi:hypothetical protein
MRHALLHFLAVIQITTVRRPFLTCLDRPYSLTRLRFLLNNSKHYTKKPSGQKIENCQYPSILFVVLSIWFRWLSPPLQFGHMSLDHGLGKARFVRSFVAPASSKRQHMTCFSPVITQKDTLVSQRSFGHVHWLGIESSLCG